MNFPIELYSKPTEAWFCPWWIGFGTLGRTTGSGRWMHCLSKSLYRRGWRILLSSRSITARHLSRISFQSLNLFTLMIADTLILLICFVLLVVILVNCMIVEVLGLNWRDLWLLNLPKSSLLTRPLISVLFEAIAIKLYWLLILRFILSILAVILMISWPEDEISRPQCFYLEFKTWIPSTTWISSKS